MIRYAIQGWRSPTFGMVYRLVDRETGAVAKGFGEFRVFGGIDPLVAAHGDSVLKMAEVKTVGPLGWPGFEPVEFKPNTVGELHWSLSRIDATQIEYEDIDPPANAREYDGPRA